MLRFLENAGGIRVYLRDIGLSVAQVGALRARAAFLKVRPEAMRPQSRSFTDRSSGHR